MAPTVYHHINHDKRGWVGDGVADLTWQKKISINFLFKVMLLPILACKWISSNDYPSKVTTFANFGLNVDLK